MSDNSTVPVKDYVRYKKIRGTHRMYCPVRERKVTLGKGREDGDIAYLLPAGCPPESNESWKRMDYGEHAAEAAEQEITEKAGDPEGTLVIKEVEGGFDVMNTATDAPINTSPLTKEEAKALVAGSPEEKKGLLAKIKDKLTGKGDEGEDDPPKDGEGDDITCPSEHEYGNDFDEHDECDECPLSESCAASTTEEKE